MAIEVDMALCLAFNTQAAVRHLQDGSSQQTIHGSPLHMILVTVFLVPSVKKPIGFFSADEQTWSRAGPD